MSRHINPNNFSKRRLGFLPWLVVLVALACSLPFQATTEAPTSPRFPTEPPDGGTSAPNSTNTELPAATQAPADTQTSIEVPAEPTATEGLTETPGAFPTVAAGVLKEQLFYGGLGGGGDEDLLCEDLIPAPGSELPLIVPEGRSEYFGMISTQTFCIFGFPFDEEIYTALYASDGKLAGEGIMQVNSALMDEGVTVLEETTGNWVWIGEAAVVEGSPTVRLYIWIPLGLPFGQWNLNFESEIMSFASPFENTPPEFLAINTLPGWEIDLIPSHGCITYGPDETVYIYGYSFEPNTSLPLGVYVDADWGDSVLVDSLSVTTGDHGEFKAWVKVKDWYPPGFYHIIPNEALFEDFIENVDATGCFLVEGTSGILVPVVPLVGPYEACPGTYWTNLRVGDRAMVGEDPPLPNRVRMSPNVQSETVGQIPPGETMVIIDGPECAHGWVWWYVTADNLDLEGWTAEGDEFNYWLLPVP